MLFKIIEISYGWFEVDFNRRWSLLNSDYLECDAPCNLIEALCNLLEKKAKIQWLCWQDEPGAHILKLERRGKRLIVEIYTTPKDSQELDFKGSGLAGEIEECVYRTEDNLMEAAKAIFWEFALYQNGNGAIIYEQHWGDFPSNSFFRLEQLLGVDVRDGNCD